MTHLLELPQEDFEELQHLVEKELAVARVETRRTFSHEFRDLVRQRIARLEHIQGLLASTASTPID